MLGPKKREPEPRKAPRTATAAPEPEEEPEGEPEGRGQARKEAHAEESEPLQRDWATFEGYDVDVEKIADEMDASDLAACKRHCERYGLGGFVVIEGWAYFRWDSAEALDARREPGEGTLHLGFAWQERQSHGVALHDEEGMPAVVRRSMGYWLDPEDLVVSSEEGQMIGGILDATAIGSHGFPRNWPGVFSESAILKSLLKKTGPCAASKISKIPPLTDEMERLVADVPLWPLQSFDNAMAVEAQTGFAVVKGWLIHDLYDFPAGTAYLAERHWWNAAVDGTWLDFTPRAEDATALLLAEAIDEPLRQAVILKHEQLLLAEGLFCLRYPCACAVGCVELGTQGAVTLALRHARESGSRAVCRTMAKAGMCSALLEHLSIRRNMLAAVQLLALLAQCIQEEGLQEVLLGPFASSDGLRVLVRLLQDERPEVALHAASAFAPICSASPRARKLALNAGAAQALAELFSRGDVRGSAADAARALWPPDAEGPEKGWAAAPEHAPRGATSGVAAADWPALQQQCHELLADEHQRQPAHDRRAHSWARTLAFAQVALGAQGVNVRRGTAERPFVIWVLCAEDTVEAYLAEEGYLNDANWLDPTPTEVVLVGEQLRELRPTRLPQQGQPAVVRSMSYEAARWLQRLGGQPPDLAAVLMPEAHVEKAVPPDHVLAAVANCPAVISSRFALTEGGAINLRCKLQGQILLRQTRCPFGSAHAVPCGSSSVHGDNAWVWAVRGAGALAKALSINLEVAPTENQELRPSSGRAPAIFWGILDIKYDTTRPVLERTKVLETGDGRISKFSHDGAVIAQRFKDGYYIDESTDLYMYSVVSSDKKLTHHIMDKNGYGHVVPKQVCFPREYTTNLCDEIADSLGVGDGERVVLKLCNRSRAAGVVVVPLEELDEVLEDLLEPPSDLEAWFQRHLPVIREGDSLDLGLLYLGSFEEQRRHWWSNECPVFVAERWCKSQDTVLEDGRRFDATMRVGFALRRRRQKAQLQTQPGKPEAELTAEDLEVDWLGAYWKLPKSDSDSGSSLRECVISAARTAGTAPVDKRHLNEIYAALGDSVQHLFSCREPSSQELAQEHKDQPELAAYLTARLGASMRSRNPDEARRMLDDANNLVKQLEHGSVKSCMESLVIRVNGVLEALALPPLDPKRWVKQEEHFRKALALMPTSANALLYIGIAALQGGRPEDAVDWISRSLLLDPDYKSPYVNLGVAYLRLGMYRHAITISEAGLARHPDTPQCNYHIGVACCQLAIQACLASDSQADESKELKARAVEGFRRARASNEARRRGREATGSAVLEPPWLEVDDRMVSAMEPGADVAEVELPPSAGWPHFMQFRLGG